MKQSKQFDIAETSYNSPGDYDFLASFDTFPGDGKDATSGSSTAGGNIVHTVQGNKAKEKKIKTSLYLSPEQMRHLKVYCAVSGTTVTEVLGKLVSNFLKRNNTKNKLDKYEDTGENNY